MATITLTAAERNDLWGTLVFTYSGDAESLGAMRLTDVSDRDVTRTADWIHSLVELGFEQEVDQPVDVQVTEQLIRVLDDAEKQVTEVLADYSKTLARAVWTADPEAFLPPAEEDSGGGWIKSAFVIRAIRERAGEVGG